MRIVIFGAALCPAGVVAAIVFLVMPSSIGDGLSGYAQLAPISIVGSLVWAVLGILVLAGVTALLLVTLPPAARELKTIPEIVVSVIRRTLWALAVSSLVLLASWVSMDVSIHNVRPKFGPLPGSGIVVAIAIVGLVSMLVVLVFQVGAAFHTVGRANGSGER